MGKFPNIDPHGSDGANFPKRSRRSSPAHTPNSPRRFQFLRSLWDRLPYFLVIPVAIAVGIFSFSGPRNAGPPPALFWPPVADLIGLTKDDFPSLLPGEVPTNITERCLYGLWKQRGDLAGKECDRVIRIYEAAIRQNNSLGMILRGDAYRVGYGGKADPVQAVRLYEEAAKAGSLDGLYLCAYMIAQGSGVPYDKAKFEDLVAANARAGHELSRLWYAEILVSHSKNDEAREQWNQAVESGSALGKIRLARSLVTTEPKDMSRACILINDAGNMLPHAEFVARELEAVQDLILGRIPPNDIRGWTMCMKNLRDGRARRSGR
jgi:hypothetical protein